MMKPVIPEMDHIEEGGAPIVVRERVWSCRVDAVPVLVIIGTVCLILGALYLTKITAGVGGIAAACFFGIVARIVQAHFHNKERRA